MNMRSIPINGGMIVKGPSQSHQVEIAPGGQAITVFEVTAIAVSFGEGDNQSNKILGAGRGISFSEQEAWQRAVEEVKRLI